MSLSAKYPHYHTDLLSMVEKYGSPLYIYDATVIEQQVQKMKNAFKEVDLQIKYAMKSLSNINILQLMKKWEVGIDCVSINEVKMAIFTGHKPQNILYTPSCVEFDEIREAVELNVRLNIGDLDHLYQLGQEFGNKVKVCIRIKPNILAGANSKISTGHIDSKFGIDISEIDEILSIVEQFNMKVEGLHKHTGSDIVDIDRFVEAADILFDVARHFKYLEYLDFGSGFKVAYNSQDVVTDIDDLGEKMTQKFNDFCKKTGKTLKFIIEPGKFLVSESGFLLIKVNVIKKTKNHALIGVNSGLNHMLRPMMYDAYHEFINISNHNGIKKNYNVVGYICETDTLGNGLSINEVRKGDILAIKNAGAYGYSMASNYNARVRPAEVLIYQGKDYLIRKTETYGDLMKGQILHELI